MLDPRVTVTLVPLFEDTHPLRTLTFTRHDMPVAIGRASKRETRKRNPATENAWFESRVMSRDHAFLKISPDQNMVFISDCGSTHGTYMNDIKLSTNEDHPLFSGDVIRFGVDVDRGHEVFEAIEVRCKIQWPKPQFVVIPDDEEKVIKLDPSSSRNSFSVPEDSDSESVELLCSDSSKEPVARSWEDTVLQPEDISPVSLDLGVQHDKYSKNEGEPPKSQEEPQENLPNLHSENLSPIESLSKVCVQATATAIDPDLPTPMSDTNPIADAKPVSDGKESCAKPTSFEFSLVQPFTEDSVPEICYQQIPEIHYNNWTMMRPMFMRLADMAWGESNTIPDIDRERRVIHSARRCSLDTDDYWVDDCPGFKPCVGTEVYWELDSEESDTSFHRMPGSLLRYWSVDKRRYWIIYEDEDTQKLNNWWWIVEKPLELLSEELKRQLETETEIDDCHKYWIVRAWKPQMVCGQWCDAAPYWDTNFDQNLLYDDDSVDSGEEGLSSEECISESGSLMDSASDYYDEYHGEYSHGAFDSESLYGVDGGASEQYLHGHDEEEDCEEDENAEEYDENSDESESDSEYSSEDAHLEHRDPQKSHIHISFEHPIHTDAVEVSKHSPQETDPKPLFQEEHVDQSLDPTRKENKPAIAQNLPPMMKPGARFPTYNVSGELPEACENKFPLMQRRIENTVGVPSFSHAYETGYHDGPFSSNALAGDVLPPYMATTCKSPLKRTATEMESSSLESDFSQDAQQVAIEPASQPDLHTISSEAMEAIASALAENVAATTENERPAKRVKPNHSSSKSLASHATTAVVSALLGGLGTIAMLAALPNEYFQ
ncbi:hypothetical protein N7457_005919 [Penicillium paradoxum]|uniref:uncharacterized protein n=1 Tax=Penicillium paradoxum TaxID=176176 RepID=UPI002548BA35|nr:uncharacterized protein N7457_005919 [Penicillium paradoxum]KAJ5780759.1 hypothetical protein N7457_005919 [Penicillium paradoxum]